MKPSLAVSAIDLLLALVCGEALALSHSDTSVSIREGSQSPTAYYISPTGSDKNAGTSANTPWQTVSRVGKLNPGDSVLFQAGVDHMLGSNGLTISQGGSPDAPVVVGSYFDGPVGGAAAAAAGPPRLHIDPGKGPAIMVYNTGYVEVCNVSVVGSNMTASKESGIALYSDTKNDDDDAAAAAGGATTPHWASVYIHDVSASGFQDGITVGAQGCAGFRDVLVERVVCMDNWLTGMQSYGVANSDCYSHASIVVRDSVFANNPGLATHTENWSGSGLVLSAVNGALVTGCEAYGNGAANGHQGGGPVGLWAWEANNVTFRHCVSHDNLNGFASGQNDGGGFDLDGGATNSLIEYCYSFRNAGPGYLVCQFDGSSLPTANNTVRYSVSLNDTLTSANGCGGLDFFSPNNILGATVYGNTFINGNGNALACTGGGDLQGVHVASNAFVALGGQSMLRFTPAPAPAQMNVSGNAYWSAAGAAQFTWGGQTYSGLAAFQSATGQEEAPRGTDADPALETKDGFFQSCVQWRESFPPVPNSPLLDTMRGFSGCS
jgi:hypothetical protein